MRALVRSAVTSWLVRAGEKKLVLFPEWARRWLPKSVQCVGFLCLFVLLCLIGRKLLPDVQLNVLDTILLYVGYVVIVIVSFVLALSVVMLLTSAVRESSRLSHAVGGGIQTAQKNVAETGKAVTATVRGTKEAIVGSSKQAIDITKEGTKTVGRAITTGSGKLMKGIKVGSEAGAKVVIERSKQAAESTQEATRRAAKWTRESAPKAQTKIAAFTKKGWLLLKGYFMKVRDGFKSMKSNREQK